MCERVASKLLGDLHHLFLVHDEPVGSPENFLERFRQFGVQRGDVLLTVFSQGIVRVGISAHRSWSIQRQNRRDILKGVGFEQAQQAPHRTTIELENPQGVATTHQFIGRAVVQREVFQDGPVSTVKLDVV